MHLVISEVQRVDLTVERRKVVVVNDENIGDTAIMFDRRYALALVRSVILKSDAYAPKVLRGIARIISNQESMPIAKQEFKLLLPANIGFDREQVPTISTHQVQQRRRSPSGAEFDYDVVVVDVGIDDVLQETPMREPSVMMLIERAQTNTPICVPELTLRLTIQAP